MLFGRYSSLFFLVLTVGFVSSEVNFAKAEDVIRRADYNVEEFSRFRNKEVGYRYFLKAPFVASRDLRSRRLDTELGLVSVFWSEDVKSVLPFDLVSAVEGCFQRVYAVSELLELPISAAPFQWNVVTINSTAKVMQKDLLSSSYLHSAWVGPPADIVVDAVNLLNSVTRSRSFRPVDARSIELLQEEFIRVFTHEISHVVEFQLMGRGFSKRKRWHGEGFALWFSQQVERGQQDGSFYSADHIQRAKAKLSSGWEPNLFMGAPEDYLLSYAVVSALVKEHSVQGLLDVYATMDRLNCSFIEALNRQFGWQPEELRRKAVEVF